MRSRETAGAKEEESREGMHTQVREKSVFGPHRKKMPHDVIVQKRRQNIKKKLRQEKRRKGQL